MTTAPATSTGEAASSPPKKTSSRNKGKARSPKSSPSAPQQPTKKRRRTAGGSTDASNNPPATATPTTPAPSSILVIDNGGDTLKYGWVQDETPRSLPNVTARLKHQLAVLVGDELQKVQNPNQLIAVTRSTERGIINNMGNQVQVWKRLLDHLGVVVPTTSEAAQVFNWKLMQAKQQQQQMDETPKTPAALCAVLLLVPPYCPRSVMDQMMMVWLEDFGVSHVGFAVSTATAAQLHPGYQCACVVDIGWSATQIVPVFQSTIVMDSNALSPAIKTAKTSTTAATSTDDEDNPQTATVRDGNAPTLTASPTIRRIPLGGRHLINMWKYYASYRQWNLMDQEWILRDVFQQLATVSLKFDQDLALARRTPAGRRYYDRNFVLPNYQTTFQGNVEIPEALKRLQEQQEDSEDEDYDMDNNDKLEGEEDDDDDDLGGFEDEEFQGEGNEEGDDEAEATNEKKSPNKKNKKQKSKKKRTKKASDEEDGENDEDDEDDDDDDEEEENENTEALRRRLMRQKQEEERRRREQEEEQQCLQVSVERFTVPELLFRPTDAGLSNDMAGLPHAIMHCIESCPKVLQPALYRSIQLTGGVSQLPNLPERLEQVLRTMVPSQLELEITQSKAPVQQAWLGARDWVRKTPYTQWSISRNEWEQSQKRSAWSRLLVSNGGTLV